MANVYNFWVTYQPSARTRSVCVSVCLLPRSICHHAQGDNKRAIAKFGDFRKSTAFESYLRRENQLKRPFANEHRLSYLDRVRSLCVP